MYQRLLIRGLGLAGLAALALTPRPAAACGGTFCDSGPIAMPVDQTGENIVFAVDGEFIEAHIQIQYQGSPERFAWVIPIQSLPTFSIGSQLLFTNLLRDTVPSYGFTTSVDQCGSTGIGGATATGGSASFAPNAGPDDPSGVNVVLKQTVGAFDITVLEGGTAQEVSDWLTINGYEQIDTAPVILQSYVQKGYFFAAVKLTGGTGVDEIHPLVARYRGDRPCVPLELTAVAAVANMGVRTFFFHRGRVVPTNYKHVTLNDLRIDWALRGTNYNDVVARGVDHPLAGGQAFVTEYAGLSNIVRQDSIYSVAWDASKFADISPELVIDELTIQGLIQCFGSGCQYLHPLLQPLLQQYLPRPGGVSEAEFYSCLKCYAERIDAAAWDAAAFATTFQERIVDPGVRAMELLSGHPYLTRMYTAISPDEMTADPEFHLREDLPDVALPPLANRRVTCSGQNVYTLPDGKMLIVGSGNTWPQFSAEMPYAAKVEEFPLQGDPIVLADNTTKIYQELNAFNATQAPLGRDGLPDPLGVGMQGADGSGGQNGREVSGAGGCACTVIGKTRPALMWAPYALVLLGALRRGRRRP